MVKGLEDMIRRAIFNSSIRNDAAPDASHIIDDIRRRQESQKFQDEIDLSSHRLSYDSMMAAQHDGLKYVLADVRRKAYEESKQLLDVEGIKDDYGLAINDGTVINPFVISSGMVKAIKEATHGMRGEREISRGIFDWIVNNIEYGTSKRDNGYSSSVETLDNRQGVCGEMAFLYITMARSLSLKSSFVEVSVDCFGNKVLHACAFVEAFPDGLYVDPAYQKYDIRHKRSRILSDAEVIQYYSRWR